MVKCTKCGSDMPNTYKYCVYCSAKMPVTNDNRQNNLIKPEITALQIGAAIGSVLVAAVLVVGIMLAL